MPDSAQLRRYHRLKAEGRCTRCGRRLPAKRIGLTLCAPCSHLHLAAKARTRGTPLRGKVGRPRKD